MIQMITQWITTNLEMVCVGIVTMPMLIAFAMALLYIVDEQCADYKWYLGLMYGAGKRDDAFAQDFFGKAFLGLGIANIVVSCIVVYGYLYLSNITLSQFIKNQTGG